jgi:4,5-DOPA dioxygenase extradiol
VKRKPALFLSHGSPTLPLERGPAVDFMKGLGGRLGRPEAILMVSAHWDTDRPAVSAAKNPETIYDFYGFPPELYRLRSPAPGAPRLAERAAALRSVKGMKADNEASRIWGPHTT